MPQLNSKTIIIGLLAVIVGVLICGLLGWIFFFASGSKTEVVVPPANVTPLPPQPTPTPPPVTFEGWRGEYFNNTTLQGQPVLTRDDKAINFGWGTAAPAPEVSAQNFSVRWTISRQVPAGIYRFTGAFDNGVRLWVDDNLIADRWTAGPVRTGSVDVNLAAGSHTARLEYFHTTAEAVAQLRVEYLENFPDWKASYFGRPDLDGPPVVVRNELEINHNWGTTSPIPGSLPDNNFSVRWNRLADFEEGNYLFRANVEGGVRLWLDEQLLLDSWNEQILRQPEATAKLSPGSHALKVEYWKQSGSGQIQVGWAKLQAPNQPPLAVINGTSYAVTGQTVSFNARSSRVAEGSHLVTFDWDFGDGTKASGVDVTHVYNSPGVFAVTLTVVDDKGLRDTTVSQIQIDNQPVTPEPGQPPRPVIDAPSQAGVGEAVTFDSSRSWSANPIVRNAWEFGDGVRIDNAVKAQNSYAAPGVYRVKLTVEDNQGLKAVTYHQIKIEAAEPQPTPKPDQPPVARISAPASVNVGDTFTVDAVDSRCATACVSYAWNLGDGAEANAVTLQHAYQSPGDFNLILTVTDDKGLQGTTNQIIKVVAPVAPPQLPTAVISSSTQAAQTGQPVTFDGSGSQPGSGGPITEYFWEFGDGSQDRSGPVVSHTFAAPGSLIVRLTVTDGQGQGHTAEWPIQISPAVAPPPPGGQPTAEPTAQP